jgi:hypothetical protein
MPSSVEVDISRTFKFQCMYEFRVLSLLNFLCRNFKVQVLIETLQIVDKMDDEGRLELPSEDVFGFGIEERRCN